MLEKWEVKPSRNDGFRRCALPSETACKVCGHIQKAFGGEVAIHFPGLACLDKPIVWAFPQLLICLDCGFAEFTVPERELKVLRTGAAVEGAVVSSGESSRRKKAEKN